MSAEQSSTPTLRTPAAAPPLLRVSDLAKAFGATRALTRCSLDLHAGEVHAIVGENGSGKSTLVKILSGVHRPDDGQITLSGEALSSRRGPRATQAAGIVTVFQEVLVVSPQSVLANIWLGSDGLFRAQIAAEEKRRRAREALAALLPEPPPLTVTAEQLSLSDRQACCIARALVRQPRVLILDESTSALDIATRDRLFTVVRRLCAAGTAVLFISHRMDEIQDLADRVTVLRSGGSVAGFTRGEASTDDLVHAMTGGDQLSAGVEKVPATRRVAADVLLEARRLRLRPDSQPIDLAIRAGELIGLAGLEGHGQDAFLQALRGAGAPAGEIRTGDDRLLRTPRHGLDAGVVYVPRDRRAESLFPPLSITENFALPTIARDRRAALIDWRRGTARLGGYVEQLSIRLANHRQPITTLSGGNQQKVIVARWLAAQPRVLLLNDPTRGVDLGAKRDLYRVLEDLCARGVAVVMLSTEVDEHLELMDRVLVFREGSVAVEIARGALTRAGLVSAFFSDAEIDHAR